MLEFFTSFIGFTLGFLSFIHPAIAINQEFGLLPMFSQVSYQGFFDGDMRLDDAYTFLVNVSECDNVEAMKELLLTSQYPLQLLGNILSDFVSIKLTDNAKLAKLQEAISKVTIDSELALPTDAWLSKILPSIIDSKIGSRIYAEVIYSYSKIGNLANSPTRSTGPIFTGSSINVCMNFSNSWLTYAVGTLAMTRIGAPTNVTVYSDEPTRWAYLTAFYKAYVTVGNLHNLTLMLASGAINSEFQSNLRKLHVPCTPYWRIMLSVARTAAFQQTISEPCLNAALKFQSVDIDWLIAIFGNEVILAKDVMRHCVILANIIIWFIPSYEEYRNEILVTLAKVYFSSPVEREQYIIDQRFNSETAARLRESLDGWSSEFILDPTECLLQIPKYATFLGYMRIFLSQQGIPEDSIDYISLSMLMTRDYFDPVQILAFGIKVEGKIYQPKQWNSSDLYHLVEILGLELQSYTGPLLPILAENLYVPTTDLGSSRIFNSSTYFGHASATYWGVAKKHIITRGANFDEIHMPDILINGKPFETMLSPERTSISDLPGKLTRLRQISRKLNNSENNLDIFSKSNTRRRISKPYDITKDSRPVIESNLVLTGNDIDSISAAKHRLAQRTDSKATRDTKVSRLTAQCTNSYAHSSTISSTKSKFIGHSTPRIGIYARSINDQNSSIRNINRLTCENRCDIELSNDIAKSLVIELHAYSNRIRDD